MKLNFEEIFNTKQQTQTKFRNNQSQVSTHLGLQSLMGSKANQKQQPTHKKFAYHIPKHNKTPTFQLIKNSQTNKNSYKYYKPSLLIDSLQNPELNYSQEKKELSKISTKKSIEKIVQRLNEPISCKKQNCRKFNYLQDERVLRENLCSFKGKPIKKSNRSLSETCQLLSKPSKAHQNLYWQYKSREFKALQKSEQQQLHREHKHRKSTYSNNQPYLTNYTTFEDRLQNQVTKKMKKKLYYNSFTDINSSLFQPDVSISMRSFLQSGRQPKIVPKMQKNTIKGNILDRSKLDYSFCSIRSKNNEKFIRKKEERIVERLCGLFVEDGVVRIVPEAIEQLDEEEFDVIFPLIEKIDNLQELDEQTFKKQILQHYNSLPVYEKSAIRNLKNIQNPINPPSITHKKTNSNTFSKGAPSGNQYYLKLKNYI